MFALSVDHYYNQTNRTNKQTTQPHPYEHVGIIFTQPLPHEHVGIENTPNNQTTWQNKRHYKYCCGFGKAEQPDERQAWKSLDNSLEITRHPVPPSVQSTHSAPTHTSISKKTQ